MTAVFTALSQGSRKWRKYKRAKCKRVLLFFGSIINVGVKPTDIAKKVKKQKKKSISEKNLIKC